VVDKITYIQKQSKTSGIMLQIMKHEHFYVSPYSNLFTTYVHAKQSRKQCKALGIKHEMYL